MDDIFYDMNNTYYGHTPLDFVPSREYKLFIIMYLLVAGLLFLHQLCRREKLIYKYYPLFCYFMPILFISHFVMTLTYFQRPLFWMLFAESKLDINYRILALLLILVPAAFVPSIPYSITLVYALFLNWKIKPSDYFLNCKITRARITAVVVTSFAMVTALRWYPPFESRYYVTMMIHVNFSVKFHIVKWLHTILTTGLLFKKLHYLLTRGKYTKLEPIDYARLVHVSLFVFIIWSTFLSCIYNEHLVYLDNPATPQTAVLSFEDSCIMQNVFIFSTYLSNVKCLKTFFDRSKVYPISLE